MHFYDTSNRGVKNLKEIDKLLMTCFHIYYSWIMTSTNTNHRATHLFEIMWFTPITPPPPRYTSLRAFPVNFVTRSTRLLWGDLLADIFSSALLSPLCVPVCGSSVWHSSDILTGTAEWGRLQKVACIREASLIRWADSLINNIITCQITFWFMFFLFVCFLNLQKYMVAGAPSADGFL